MFDVSPSINQFCNRLLERGWQYTVSLWEVQQVFVQAVARDEVIWRMSEKEDSPASRAHCRSRSIQLIGDRVVCYRLVWE